MTRMKCAFEIVMEGVAWFATRWCCRLSRRACMSASLLHPESQSCSCACRRNGSVYGPFPSAMRRAMRLKQFGCHFQGHALHLCLVSRKFTTVRHVLQYEHITCNIQRKLLEDKQPSTYLHKSQLLKFENKQNLVPEYDIK